MKKLIVIGGAIIGIFSLILIVMITSESKSNNALDNPYKTTKNLEQSSIDLIDNENYKDIILPDDLADKIESGESLTVYYFSPECVYCMEMTPILTPISDEMNVTVYKYNLLEFYPEAQSYDITGTPTLVHYADGVEVARIVGSHPKENIRAFLEEFNKSQSK